MKAVDEKGADEGKDGKIVLDDVSNDVTEIRDRTYVYLGLRYRGTILPKFLLNAFVREGATVYQNSIGLEADFRTNNFSIIPSLTYTEFGLGDTLFLEKNKDENFAGNWSNVNSTLKGIFVGADFLWSAKLSRTLDFEYGVGVGVGVLFGDLETSWVYQNANGPWVSSDGTKRFSPCITEGDGIGCRKIEHSNATVAKVNRYKEANWFNGGYLPAFLPQLSIPSLGLRFKPHPRFQARLGLGMSLSGFWFGLSANYGVTAPKKAPPVEKEEEATP
ncbi:MAG: hypothetical protein KBF88_05015 [Polyangiaceae bacterium]|nr:hypothetical protein [Polyangiaceae bacterium]